MDEEEMRIIQKVRGLLKRRGYEIYSRPFELNIVGLRNRNPRKADEIHVFYKINAKNWNYHLYQAVTDPVAILKGKKDSLLLKEGQYTDAYKTGLHNGKVNALIESKPIVVLQEFDRDFFLSEGKSKRGLFKIDIIPLSALEKEDEGSQVILSEENFKELMDLCRKHKELYGDQFTYTLIDFRAGKRSLFKKGIAIAASLLTSLLLGFIFKDDKGKKKK